MQAFRSLLFNAVMLFSAIIYAPLCILAYPLPFRHRFKVIKQWARFNLWVLSHLCHLTYQVKGRENIPQGPAVIICKHQSAWETLVLQNIFPSITWVLKKQLLYIPFFGWGLAMLDPVAINRQAKTKALTQLLTQGGQRLKQGRSLVIFPEGTRTLPGEQIKYQAGGAMLATKTGFPVVPVAHNAGEYWPKDSFVKHPGIITISIGPTILTSGLKTTEVNQQAQAWIESEMAVIEAVKKIPNARF